MATGGGLTITLGWPDKKLNPNARPNHFALRKAQTTANEEAYWVTRAAMGAAWGPAKTAIEHDGKSDILLRQIAHPPDSRLRDRDNVDSALKGHRDGIARALGVNDRFLRPTGIEWGEAGKPGKIVIVIGGGA